MKKLIYISAASVAISMQMLGSYDAPCLVRDTLDMVRLQNKVDEEILKVEQLKKQLTAQRIDNSEASAELANTVWRAELQRDKTIYNTICAGWSHAQREPNAGHMVYPWVAALFLTAERHGAAIALLHDGSTTLGEIFRHAAKFLDAGTEQIYLHKAMSLHMLGKYFCYWNHIAACYDQLAERAHDTDAKCRYLQQAADVWYREYSEHPNLFEFDYARHAAKAQEKVINAIHLRTSSDCPEVARTRAIHEFKCAKYTAQDLYALGSVKDDDDLDDEEAQRLTSKIYPIARKVRESVWQMAGVQTIAEACMLAKNVTEYLHSAGLNETAQGYYLRTYLFNPRNFASDPQHEVARWAFTQFIGHEKLLMAHTGFTNEECSFFLKDYENVKGLDQHWDRCMKLIELRLPTGSNREASIRYPDLLHHTRMKSKATSKRRQSLNDFFFGPFSFIWAEMELDKIKQEVALREMLAHADEKACDEIN